MCDAQRHMQALHQLLQGCSCLPSMPDLRTRIRSVLQCLARMAQHALGDGLLSPGTLQGVILGKKALRRHVECEAGLAATCLYLREGRLSSLQEGIASQSDQDVLELRSSQT